MKIHEINLSGVLAWSPFNHPLTVATGGAAGALDSSFSTSHTLSLYSVDEPSSTPKASVSVPAGFQKLAWSSFGLFLFPFFLLIDPFFNKINKYCCFL